MSFKIAARLLAIPAFAAFLLVPACAEPEPGEPPTSEIVAELSKAERLARYPFIRDAVNARGLTGKGYLFAGIAYQETGLAHCWSEATWACKGPDSPDCGGGPVIAGAGDGACSLQQGGLGMFQFDGGTFTQTLQRDGEKILTVAGNVDRAVDFVLNMVKVSKYTTNADTIDKAAQWIRDFDFNNATLRDQWIKTVTAYYNGCSNLSSATCSDRYTKYNAGLQIVVDETGLPFWGEQAPAFKASFVSQSFPFASEAFLLGPGETKAGYLDLKNEGKEAWKKGEIFLGTSNPRDAASPLASGWISPSRAATVDADTAPGAVGRFSFSVQGPDKAGDYPQYFNLLREGVAWFSDGGQGGPPDDQLQIKVTVQIAPCPAGSSPTFVCVGNERVKCDPANGKVVKETCASGCQAGVDGATCAGAAAGGSGGSGGSSAGGGKGGSAGTTGGKGGSATGGKGGAAGQSGQTGQGASGQGSTSAGGATSKGGAGGADASRQRTVAAAPEEADSGCATTAPRGAGASAFSSLAAISLALFAARRRRSPSRPA
jgi:hypothetical protein